ncbi:MAG: rod shape-determining protein MreD [Bacteroidales bacterium]|nr:rod shape-determining protein MreD [Bacteroidales bacterium]
MNSIYITIWFFVCFVLQVLIFNHLAIAGGIVLFYVYLLVKMPVEINRPLQIAICFLLGLLIDIFSNTPGMNALACTTIAWVRLPILHAYVVADDFKSGSPNRRAIGQSLFNRYCISIILCHAFLLYLIEAFTCFNILQMLIKIVISTVLTSIIFIGLEEFMSRRKKEK